MKLKVSKAIILVVVVAFSTLAQDTEAPDEEKVSYALGMNLGLEIKRMGADVDVDAIVQAIKDVTEGKPTRIGESEVRPIVQQELAYQKSVMSRKNKAEGEAYLAKNAKAAGVIVLPDGLQYRVIQAGAGPSPKIDDNVTVNSRGTMIDGKEMDHRENFQVSLTGQMKGLQEALQLMQAGSKWQVTVPPALAFGNEWKGDVGPDSTLIFEIELISIAPSVHTGGGSNGRQPPATVK
jgi:FKBP-type peptidyl-prolyl cis-trans isomerase